LTKDNAVYWIESLKLKPHPEGGFYKEIYRSSEIHSRQALPARFNGDRCFATSIYFLLEKNDFSQFHRIASDEIWHFYAGDPLELHVLNPAGRYEKFMLGASPDENQFFQLMVKAGDWFGARLKAGGLWSLLGCMVAPGFDFADFEIADRARLIKTYPDHRTIIEVLTRP